MATFRSELMRGSLDLMVLSVLSAGPKYGYLLQQELREASRGLVDTAAGTLYPLLHRLEADKIIRSRWDVSTGRRRKWYELTAAGRRRLAEQAQEWHEYSECLSSVLAPFLKPIVKPA
jgi:PadR family transcriptional regulator, regulatory protein PadR